VVRSRNLGANRIRSRIVRFAYSWGSSDQRGKECVLPFEIPSGYIFTFQARGCFNTQDAIQETIIESYHSCEGDLRDNPCSVKHWRAQYVAHTVVSYLCSGTVGTWCRSSVPRSRDGSRIDCLAEAHLESPASIHLGSAPLATFATVKVDMLFSVRLHPS